MNLVDKYSETIGVYTSRILEEFTVEAQRYHPVISDIYKAIEEYVGRRGKRIASTGFLAVYTGYRGKIDDEALKIAAAIEVYRHSILVHDDLVDEDRERRGGKAMHVTLAEKLGERFGLSSVFVGNILYALSSKLIAESGFSKDEKLRILELQAEAYREVNESQILDLAFEFTKPNEEEWYTMASRRAASLFKLSFKAGGILGGASEEDVRLLEEAAFHVGAAFDIQDDLIDLIASEDEYGRKPGGDLAKRKKPLYIVYYLETGGKELQQLLGKGELSYGELEKARSILREKGILDKTVDRALLHAEEALKILRRTEINEEGIRVIEELLELITRKTDWYR